jgi:hypothetical protein
VFFLPLIGGFLLSISLPLSVNEIRKDKTQEKHSKQEERLGTLPDPGPETIHIPGPAHKDNNDKATSQPAQANVCEEFQLCN